MRTRSSGTTANDAIVDQYFRYDYVPTSTYNNRVKPRELKIRDRPDDPKINEESRKVYDCLREYQRSNMKGSVQCRILYAWMAVEKEVNVGGIIALDKVLHRLARMKQIIKIPTLNHRLAATRWAIDKQGSWYEGKIAAEKGKEGIEDHTEYDSDEKEWDGKFNSKIIPAVTNVQEETAATAFVRQWRELKREEEGGFFDSPPPPPPSSNPLAPVPVISPIRVPEASPERVVPEAIVLRLPSSPRLPGGRPIGDPDNIYDSHFDFADDANYGSPPRVVEYPPDSPCTVDGDFSPYRIYEGRQYDDVDREYVLKSPNYGATPSPPASRRVRPDSPIYIDPSPPLSPRASYVPEEPTMTGGYYPGRIEEAVEPPSRAPRRDKLSQSEYQEAYLGYPYTHGSLSQSTNDMQTIKDAIMQVCGASKQQQTALSELRTLAEHTSARLGQPVRPWNTILIITTSIAFECFRNSKIWSMYKKAAESGMASIVFLCPANNYDDMERVLPAGDVEDILRGSMRNVEVENYSGYSFRMWGMLTFMLGQLYERARHNKPARTTSRIGLIMDNFEGYVEKTSFLAFQALASSNSVEIEELVPEDDILAEFFGIE